MVRWLVVAGCTLGLVIAACSQGHDIPTIDCTVPIPQCTADSDGAMCGYTHGDASRTRLCTCEGGGVFVCNDCDTTDAPPTGSVCLASDRCVWETVDRGCLCACGTDGKWFCSPSRPDTISC